MFILPQIFLFFKNDGDTEQIYVSLKSSTNAKKTILPVHFTVF